MVQVNPPPLIRMPKKFAKDPELNSYFTHLERFWLQMWTKIGGGDDIISQNIGAEDSNNQIMYLSGLLQEIRYEIQDIDKNAAVIDLSGVLNRLDNIENNMQTITLNDIYQRLNDIEDQI